MTLVLIFANDSWDKQWPVLKRYVGIFFLVVERYHNEASYQILRTKVILVFFRSDKEYMRDSLSFCNICKAPYTPNRTWTFLGLPRYYSWLTIFCRYLRLWIILWLPRRLLDWSFILLVFSLWPGLNEYSWSCFRAFPFRWITFTWTTLSSSSNSSLSTRLPL